MQPRIRVHNISSSNGFLWVFSNLKFSDPKLLCLLYSFRIRLKTFRASTDKVERNHSNQEYTTLFPTPT
jgi:hypothetical protein